jgi:hypothetical protein
MRKHIINATEPNPHGTSEEWLNLEEIARVEVSSEDPQYPIELAFKHAESPGWRANQPGEQTIRLLFDEPKDIRRISLRFSEPQVERTQQFTLRWADNQPVPSERSFDSNGTLIPEIRQWRWKTTKSICIRS